MRAQFAPFCVRFMTSCCVVTVIGWAVCQSPMSFCHWPNAICPTPSQHIQNMIGLDASGPASAPPSLSRLPSKQNLSLEPQFFTLTLVSELQMRVHVLCDAEAHLTVCESLTLEMTFSLSTIELQASKTTTIYTVSNMKLKIICR